jgi:hypothetical protein
MCVLESQKVWFVTPDSGHGLVNIYIYICKVLVWCSCLGHCARSWQTAGLIPNVVIGIFH